MRTSLFSAALLLLLASAAHAQETQRLYLSGKGKDDAIPWDFMCSAGMHANTWSTINVPSNWELQGFGIYTYGRDNLRPWPKVQGHYKRTFNVPPAWAAKRLYLCFDGSMTDTQATINGKSAGPLHQGGYYPFRYDITDLVTRDADNLLEVTVDDESANASVNNAERRGDYWNFAGIFRPVYLEALPTPVAITRADIDAKADGTISVDISLQVTGGIPANVRGPDPEVRVLDLQGNLVGTLTPAPNTDNHFAGNHFTGKIDAPRQWTAETPNLYQLETHLVDAGRVIHTVRQKFGFRTIEVRRGDTPNPGLFVNGRRIMLKGADRHSFWPDSGRTLSEQISRDDIQVMKDMNMNAVRMSHYPPDAHFLDLCDEMGMYVLDELAGWHQRYDSPTGHRLVQEMVTRDINHPSILFWDNGNEGGWNTELDDDFARWDPQKRALLHPWESFRGIDTKHYPVYSLLQQKAAGTDLFFPTEMLHGLYDGGAGAGLEDYWNVLQHSKVAAGGFIWALVDESVKRTDQNGRLDSKGNQAPDGILGPYREKEASFYTIKQLWSPIVITKKGNDYLVENRYSFTDAKDCTYTLEARQLPRLHGHTHAPTVLAHFEVKPGGSIPPGSSGKLNMPPLPAGMAANTDVTALIVKDPTGRELWTYTWPANIGENLKQSALDNRADKVSSTQNDAELSATVGDLSVRFSRQTGQITAISRAGKTFSLINGPRFIEGLPSPEPAPRNNRGTPTSAPAPLPPAPPSTLTSLTSREEGNDLLITATYSGALKTITYRLRPNGWITLDYSYSLTGPRDYFGIAFDYPDANVRSMRYLGEGPSRVWKNRLAGTTLNVWQKQYNDTSTAEPSPDQTAPFTYPEFKGIYNGVRWLTLETTEGPIHLIVDQKDPIPSGETPANAQPLFIQVLKPRLPAGRDALKSGVNVPDAGLAFLHAIPAIGNKFDSASVLGPQSQPTSATGEYRGAFSLYFGPLAP